MNVKDDALELPQSGNNTTTKVGGVSEKHDYGKIILWKMPSFTIVSFGFFVGFGGFLSVMQVWFFFGYHGQITNPAHVMNLVLILGLGIPLGAYVIVHLIDLPRLMRGEVTFIQYLRTISFGYLGGLLSTIALLFLYGKYMNLRVNVLMDAATLGLPLAQAIGRIGCLNYGCCHGKVAKPNAKWWVQYNNSESKILRFSPNMAGAKLYPTQIYSAIANFFIYVILLTLFITLDQRPVGLLAAVYLILYAVKRFSIEFLRGEHPRTEWMGFSAWQWISIMIAMAGTIFAYSIFVQTGSTISLNNETLHHINNAKQIYYQSTSFENGLNMMISNTMPAVLLAVMLTLAYSVHGKKLGKW